MKQDADVTEFVRRAAETVAWCAQLVDASATAEVLRPSSLPGRGCFGDRWTSRASQTLEERHTFFERDRQCVDRLALERRRLLRSAGTSLEWSPEAAQRGRFLMIPPWDSFFSQAMSPASDGFFELDGDLPPWATWVAYYACQVEDHRRRRGGRGAGPEVLVCWVPPAWIERAARGIHADELGMASLWPADDPERMARRALEYVDGRWPTESPWVPRPG